MPGDDDSITDDAIWEALPVSPQMLFEGLRLGSAALGLSFFDFAVCFKYLGKINLSNMNGKMSLISNYTT